MSMSSRLLGLETEYAIRFTPDAGSESPDNDVIYEVLRSAIDTLILTRAGDRARQQFFIENGGAFAYEFLPYAPAGGLIEGATPECRGPGEGLLYQKAQDALLIDALPLAQALLARRGYHGNLGVLKNCRDAQGHVYGAQENYEVEIASGIHLWLWRLGLVALTPLVLLSTLLSWLSFVLFMALWIGAVMITGLASLASRRVRASAALDELLFVSPRRSFERALGCIEFVLYGHLLWAPVLWPMFALIRLFAFRRVRRDALAFLITRSIFTGAGTLGLDGRLSLSEKGLSVRRVMRLWVSQRDRALFDSGNLCKAALRVTYFDVHRFLGLFRRRQRMQLGLSDSNMAQTAEYLKLGVTSLIVDMAEAGALEDLPRLARPLEALQLIIADPSLSVRVAVTARGGSLMHAPMRALDIQRAYLARAQAFVARSSMTSLETAELLDLWRRTLDALEASPETLIGHVDWVTKRYLIDTAGKDQDYATRKKIDLKYHELGCGYFARLEERGLAPVIWSGADIQRARREPPAGTPAHARSRAIRDLGRKEAHVQVAWDRIRVGKPIGGTVIWLDDYRNH